ESDAMHVRMTHERGAGLAVAGDDIHDAGRENPVAQFAEPQARKRRLFRSLDDDAIAGGERRRRFLGAKTERMIERIDLDHDAIRLAAREVQMPRALRKSL